MIHRRGGIVTRYFTPKNPRTIAQQAHRTAFRNYYMASLTQAQADLLYSAIMHEHDDLYSLLGHVHSYIGFVTPYNHANDVYRVGGSPGGSSAFSAKIASKSGSTLVYKAPITGVEAALVVNSTSQLAKMRLYNTTRGTSLLISQSVVATKTITFTAAVPTGTGSRAQPTPCAATWILFNSRMRSMYLSLPAITST